MPGDVVGSFRWFQHGYYKAKFQSGLDGLLLSRPLLEGTIRRRVMQLPNVRILDSTRVMALLVEDGVVRGVRIQQLREAKTSLAPISSSTPAAGHRRRRSGSRDSATIGPMSKR